MFYELYDWDFDEDKKCYSLINLSEVLQINKNAGIEDRRNAKTGQVYKIYKIKIYYTGKGNEWAFYYRSESERHIVYEQLKQALINFKQLPEEPENPNDISNILKEDSHPLEDLLRNPGILDIPEVKLCE